MNNHLEIYQKNTREIAVFVQGLQNLTPYVPYLSVKRKATDASTVLFKAGTVNDTSGTFTFSLSEVDTSLNVADYIFDVTIIGEGNKLTIVRDTLSILDTCYE